MQIIHERGDAQVDLTGRGTGMNTDYWHVLSPSHVLVSSCVPQVFVLFLHSGFLIAFMSFCSSVSCNLEIPESRFHICLLILILKGAFLLRLPDSGFFIQPLWICFSLVWMARPVFGSGLIFSSSFMLSGMVSCLQHMNHCQSDQSASGCCKSSFGRF